MNERKYCIYMHKNKINGKVYIGATCLNPKLRWANGKGYIGNKTFYSDICEYGWDNFEHFIIENELNKYESKSKEIYYINMYKNNCYNKTRGGEQGIIKYNTEEEYNNSKKINNSEYYKNHKNEIIQKIIQNQQNNKSEYNNYKRKYYYDNEEYHKYKIEYQREYRKRKKLEMRTD